MKKIILVGGGGHALSVADSIIQSGEYDIVGYTDFRPCDDLKLKYLGNDDELQKCYNDGVKYAFVCVGFMGKGRLRDSLYERLKETGFEIPAIVDSTAAVAGDCRIGRGSFIGKNAVVNAGSLLGDMVIINTGAIVEHSCRVGDHTHVAVGSILCGDVSVGTHCLIGAGAVINRGLKVGDETIIGAGAVVLEDMPEKCTAFGVPARVIRKNG